MSTQQDLRLFRAHERGRQGLKCLSITLAILIVAAIDLMFLERAAAAAW